MAKNDYRAVLRDLKERRAKLDAAIEVVEGILGVGKEKTVAPTAAESAQPPHAAPVSASAQLTDSRQFITLMDAAYMVLKEAGKPLHAKEIAAQVTEKYGKSTTYNSIAASLPKSAGNRFQSLGSNTFGLTEWNN